MNHHNSKSQARGGYQTIKCPDADAPREEKNLYQFAREIDRWVWAKETSRKMEAKHGDKCDEVSKTRTESSVENNKIKYLEKKNT